MSSVGCCCFFFIILNIYLWILLYEVHDHSPEHFCRSGAPVPLNHLSPPLCLCISCPEVVGTFSQGRPWGVASSCLGGWVKPTVRSQLGTVGLLVTLTTGLPRGSVWCASSLCYHSPLSITQRVTQMERCGEAEGMQWKWNDSSCEEARILLTSGKRSNIL